MLQRITMNNKGFTLLELLAVIVIISIISVTSVSFIGTTLSSSKEESYKLLKDNIITAGYSYISECTAGTLECDFTFDDKNTFKARTLENTGFFKKLESPIDGAYLGDCITLKATKLNGVIVVDLIDSCYK